MKVLITGTSQGIGKEIANKFIANGHQVFGLDINKSTIDHDNYHHFCCNIYNDPLPEIDAVDILINNAGIQTVDWINNDTNEINYTDIDINLKGTVRITEKYGIQPTIKSILIVASISAHSGAEFPCYAASKGGTLAYTKNVASRVAKYGATCNSISPGAVITELNNHIIENESLYEAVANESLLNKWIRAEEIADWVYFITVINKSMTAQDIIIDNGEIAKFNFIW